MRILNTITDDEMSEDQELNNVIYDKMKTQFVKEFSGKIIVIAEGKFLGAEDSLENAWALASNYNTALVTRIEKKVTNAKIRGSSLRMTASECA
jgi:vacuolar-type H+-ATPase subunit B/Vma2